MPCPACGLLTTADLCPLCCAEGVVGSDPDGDPVPRRHRLSVPPEHDAWHDLLSAWFVGGRLSADVLGRGERTWLDRRMGWARAVGGE